MDELQLDEKRILEALEPKRKKKNLLVIFMLSCFLIPIVAIFIGMFSSQYVAVIVVCGFLLAIVAFIISAVMLEKAHKEYEYEYKQLISKHVLNLCFDGARYEPLRGFTPKEFRDAHLIQWRNGFRYASEDMITGEYEGVEFKQSDVWIVHDSGGDHNRTVEDVNGRLMQFHYKKAIASPILIVTATHNALLETGLSKVEMEDVDFNEKFEVYSEDGQSVYYLLTPPFMEYLKELLKLDRNFYISFDGENLYILRSGKGGIFRAPSGKLDIHAEVEQSKKELNEIVKVIEILQLENKVMQEKIIKEATGHTSEQEKDSLEEIEPKPYVMTKTDVRESGKGAEHSKTVSIVIWFIALAIILLMIFLSH